MTLVRRGELSTGSRDDVDAVLDRMVRKKYAGEARRDVAREVLSGKVAEPKSAWAAVVALKGQPWLYFVRPKRDPDAAQTLAAKAGLVTMAVGAGRVSGMRFVHVFEGRRMVEGFESQGLDLRDPVDRSELLDAVPESGTRQRAWWTKLRDEREIIDALVRERGAYVPWVSAGANGGSVEISGWDDDGPLAPGDYERIDVVALGAGAKLGARNPADRELDDAIEQGDVARVRKAIADGADLASKLPGSKLGPLEKAVGGFVGWNTGRREAWLEVTRALLEAGADVAGTGGDIPPVGVLAERIDLTDEQVVEGVELLLAHGADFRQRTASGIPAIHLLAEKGKLAALELLHRRGVDMAGKGKDGTTARRHVERLMKQKRLTWISVRVAKKVIDFLKAAVKERT